MRGPGGWTRGRGSGRVIAALACVTAGLLAFPSVLPNSPGRLGSLLESFLPWLGPVVALLAVLALIRRSVVALVALLLPVAVWSRSYGVLLLPSGSPNGRELVVVQHNVSDENPDPVGTARALAAAGPDLIALQELVDPARREYEAVLAPEYPYHVVHGTVGLWSRHPLADAQPLDIKPRDIAEGWNRALRAVVRMPSGDVVAYVAHLPSVRVGAGGLASARRDESAGLLGRMLAAEEANRVVLLGDLNGTVDDRGLAPLTSRLGTPERGFAFSFPAGLPVARIDQVLARGAVVRSIRTLPATGSDHLPVTARIALR
ncbi:endonuclease/exonuclease/phosphatase family protein [Streptomyces sp. NPDC001728]|uniref:endonuclease/exonuclease/phosphatase family protein n=1 Tax=Streptomyces sp. NPDC001728 TaxID=3154396 RepID=UPI00331E97F4